MIKNKENVLNILEKTLPFLRVPLKIKRAQHILDIIMK
jgi:hypothetical protein